MPNERYLPALQEDQQLSPFTSQLPQISAADNNDAQSSICSIAIFRCWWLHVGFHQAGFRTIVACELLDEAAATLSTFFDMPAVASSVLSPNNGSSPKIIRGDIRGLDYVLLPKEPDVVIGGPPCQDFSMAKAQTREGLNGGNCNLYAEFVRAIMFLQPKLFVFENVPGLVSANRGLAYDTIRNDFQRLEEIVEEQYKGIRQVPQHSVEGYTLLFSGIVDGPSLGVPQTRRRLIMIGAREDQVSEFQAPRVEEEICA